MFDTRAWGQELAPALLEGRPSPDVRENVVAHVRDLDRIAASDRLNDEERGAVGATAALLNGLLDNWSVDNESADVGGDPNSAYQPAFAILDLISGGHQAHFAKAHQLAGPWVVRIAVPMHLIAFVLNESKEKMQFHEVFPNDLAATACFTEAFRGIRAAVTLSMHGYYLEAPCVQRLVYEAAGLGRHLAKRPDDAEKWLRQQQWYPDSIVRKAIEAETAPEGDQSPYGDFYKMASAAGHPMALTALPFVLQSDGAVRPMLFPEFDENALVGNLRALLLEGVFVCFAIRRAIANDQTLPPEWLKQLTDVAREATGQEMSYLTRDWDLEQATHDELQRYVLPASELEDYLSKHPNSVRNIRKRWAEGKWKSPGSGGGETSTM